MAINNDLPMKYSNLMYATKAEVIKDMKVPFIDNIWNKILEYRSNFQTVLTLNHITGTGYNVCLTPAIVDRVCSVERKIMRAMVNFSKLSKASKMKFRNDSYIEILRSVAKKYGIPVDDDTLKNIVTGNASLLQPSVMILAHYVAALDEITLHYEQEPDDSFLGHVYQDILGGEELVEFYRTTDDDLPFNKTLVNKVYLGIPYNAISSSMDELFNFVKNSNVSVFIKASCALYYLYYVKPFDAYSEEIAILFFKEILAHEDIESVAAFLNFEKLLINKDELEKVITESQTTFDLTYILNYILKYTESFINDFLDKIVVAKRDDIAVETYSVDEETTTNEEATTTQQQVETVTQPVPTQVVRASGAPIFYNQDIAISSLPGGLSESDADELMNHLLEKYPDLKRAQAYFYSRHCSLGMKYTISQYQRANACAYETARSSMDNLVYLGFYRKESLKNKYVYIPIKRN